MSLPLEAEKIRTSASQLFHVIGRGATAFRSFDTFSCINDREQDVFGFPDLPPKRGRESWQRMEETGAALESRRVFDAQRAGDLLAAAGNLTRDQSGCLDPVSQSVEPNGCGRDSGGFSVERPVVCRAVDLVHRCPWRSRGLIGRVRTVARRHAWQYRRRSRSSDWL